MAFLTSEQTGGPPVFALRQHNFYLAVDFPNWHTQAFNVRQLAKVLSAAAQAQGKLGHSAGDTWQEHASLIKLACMDGQLFKWLDKIGDGDDSN